MIRPAVAEPHAEDVAIDRRFAEVRSYMVRGEQQQRPIEKDQQAVARERETAQT